MFAISPWSVYGLAAATAIVVIVVPIARFLLSTRRPSNYPPGPKPVLGLGNLHQIPTVAPFLQFYNWSKTFGDIVGLKAGPGNLIILNSADAIHELFSKRGTAYSGRPYLYIPTEHVFKGHADKHLLGVQDSTYLRWFRASVTPVLNAKVPEDGCLAMQDISSTRLVHGILQKPLGGAHGGLETQAKRWALEAPLLVVVGERTDDRPDEFVDGFFDELKLWLDVLEPSQTPPVDIIPPLRWVPEALAGWKRKARAVKENNLKYHARYLAAAKRLVGSSGPVVRDRKTGKDSLVYRSIATRLLDKNGEVAEEKRVTDDQLRFLAGNIIEAAVTTTLAALLGLVLYLAVLPEVQDKAREEIDRVSGNALPGPEIIHQLPYIQACVLELLRIRPPAPLGLGHLADRDDTYQGYTIPKGSTVLPNLYALGQDPSLFEDPDFFDPERFIRHPHGLKDDANASEGARKATHAFGAGRRICPGEQFARNSLVLALAKLVWAFNIVPAQGEMLDVSLEGGFDASFDLKPKPFKIDFLVRDEAKQAEIVTGIEAASGLLDDMFS